MSPTDKIPRNTLENWDVVVVDDEVDSLEVAARILKYYHANVYTATNGQEGLELIQAIKPRFVISDLSMPKMDGWGMLYEMQLDRELSEIPVIALTAHAMRGDRERALAAGFQNYLTKPLTPATFIKELLLVLIDIPSFTFEPRIIEYIQG